MFVEKMSVSCEDYLEAIVVLGGSGRHPVRSVDVAESLDVSKASVSKALSILKERGLVDQPPYGDITLTEEGLEYGTWVLDRHRLLFKFMTETLGIDSATADEEACKMEHAMSDESFAKWSAFVNGLERD